MYQLSVRVSVRDRQPLKYVKSVSSSNKAPTGQQAEGAIQTGPDTGGSKAIKHAPTSKHHLGAATSKQ